MKKCNTFVLSSALALTIFLSAVADAATVICTKNSNGAVTLRQNRCRRGETRVRNRSQLIGATGPAGAAGEPGSLRVFGDGSAGDVVQTTDISAPTDDPNRQYHDFTVPAGASIIITSGTVIRCTGTFTNLGTITVYRGAFATYGADLSATTYVPAWPAPHPGGSSRSAVNGEVGTGRVYGGFGGFALIAASARALLHPSPTSGGGAGGTGGKTIAYFQSIGGGGGGALVVLAKEGIVNSGTIRANGDDTQEGAGGGGGGLIILAGNGAVTNYGVLQAKGGAGGNSTTASGPGGGGGGGIIHFLSPSITAGAPDVSGGNAGTGSIAATDSLRTGGGGGGALGGDGGSGGRVNADNSVGSASAGYGGLVLQTTGTNLDVSSLF